MTDTSQTSSNRQESSGDGEGDLSLPTTAISAPLSQTAGTSASIYSSSLSSSLDADNLLRSMGDGGGQAVWSEDQPQGVCVCVCVRVCIRIGIYVNFIHVQLEMPGYRLYLSLL